MDQRICRCGLASEGEAVDGFALQHVMCKMALV